MAELFPETNEAPTSRSKTFQSPPFARDWSRLSVNSDDESGISDTEIDENFEQYLSIDDDKSYSNNLNKSFDSVYYKKSNKTKTLSKSNSIGSLTLPSLVKNSSNISHSSSFYNSKTSSTLSSGSSTNSGSTSSNNLSPIFKTKSLPYIDISNNTSLPSFSLSSNSNSPIYPAHYIQLSTPPTPTTNLSPLSSKTSSPKSTHNVKSLVLSSDSFMGSNSSPCCLSPRSRSSGKFVPLSPTDRDIVNNYPSLLLRKNSKSFSFDPANYI